MARRQKVVGLNKLIKNRRTKSAYKSARRFVQTFASCSLLVLPLLLFLKLRYFEAAGVATNP